MLFFFQNKQQENVMKKVSKILKKLREKIYSTEFMEKHRLSERHFTRNRSLTFLTVTFLVINQFKNSIADELFKFCDYFHKNIISKSAFIKARQKLCFNAFIDLNNILVENFYDDKKIKKFHGMIALAIDGFKFQLPEGCDIISHFGTMKNQSKNEMPAAQCSLIYDVLNGLTLNAKIAPCTDNERDLAIYLINNLLKEKKKNSEYLFLFDRGYPSIIFLLYLISNGIPFVMRAKVDFLKEIKEIIKSEIKDNIVEINLKDKKPKDKDTLLKYFPELSKKSIKIRVVLVKLKTGEIEVLLTSLIDKLKFKYKIFKKLYFLRWSIEESIKFKKNRAQIENISGKTINTVRQDFYSCIFLINVTSIIAIEAKKVISKDPRIKKRKYEYEINYNLAYGKIKNTFIATIMNEDVDLKKYSEKIIALMIMNLEPYRPTRVFERKCKHPKKKFYMNERRVA